jgi:hypothetical protein
MPQTEVQLALGAHRRSGVPEAVQLNCLAELFPPLGQKPGLLARPGVETLATVGLGPTRALYSRPGLFDDASLALSGTALYTLTTAAVATAFTGTVAGTDRVDVTAGQDSDLNSVARIATGSALYKAVSGAVTAEDFPTTGGAGASTVAYHRGDWLAAEAGTDKVYYQLSGTTTWTALSFVSAEYEADKVKAIRSLGEMVCFLGESTFEPWRKTGEAAPSPDYEPYGGLNQNVGCRSRDAAIVIGETLVFVDDKCMVRQFDGGALKIISDSGLAEQIRGTAATDLRAWTYELDGHRLYILTLGGDSTWVYDLNNPGPWTRFSSTGYDYWRAHLGCTVGGTVLAADSLSNAIYRLNPNKLGDNSTTFPVAFTAFDQVADVGMTVSEVRLECDTGVGLNTGQGSAPLVSMKWSDNEGRSWSNLTYKSLGAMGTYVRVIWRRLGIMRKTRIRIYQFIISDPVTRRISGVWRRAG